MDPALYREVVERIRARNDQVLINLTTGAGARFVPSNVNPNVNSLNPGIVTSEARIAHVLELRPDICSLDIGSMNFGGHVFVNTPDYIYKMAEAIRAANVKPELELFDLGHVRFASYLLDKGYLADPPWFQLCLGIPWGAPANADALHSMVRALPPSAIWSAFGISKDQFPTAALALAMGGHIRVGLEDNIYMSKGKLAKGNAELVERAATLITTCGYDIATPKAARAILGLRAAH
ncbi:hypothetical protein CDEF62S_00135 [Castellaniella defragrans]